MENVLNMLEPSVATINGVEVPLLFNMYAASLMEKELETPYLSIISEIMGTGNEAQASIPWDRQAVIISCMIRAGGMPVSSEQLMQAVHMSDAQELASAAITEMVRKQPKGKEAKNG